MGRDRSLIVWSSIWMALVAVGLLTFMVSRLPVMNPPQCPGDALSLPDGSRCIIGANIGAGLLWLFGIGLTAVAALAMLITPPASLLVRAVRARRPGRQRSAALPGQAAVALNLTGGTVDWAGRLPCAPPVVPGTAPASNQLCLVSMVTGIVGVVCLVLCALLSAPLGIVAVITGAFGLGELRGSPSEGRRQAIAGISCGAGSVLVQMVILGWFVVTG